jgi:hypothetical protein
VRLGDKLKGLKNTSDSNLEILLNSIKEGDEVIMDFNYTMTGRRDPTYRHWVLFPYASTLPQAYFQFLN